MPEHRSLHEYINQVRQSFENKADPDNARPMKKYMRDKFIFCGIKTPLRRKLSKEFQKKEKRPHIQDLDYVVKAFWEMPEREFQYFACELVGEYKKEFTPELIDLLEYMVVNKSWWDTVDGIAKHLLGNYLEKFPHGKGEYVDRWLKSNNMWLQRSAILFQLGYKQDTDFELLQHVILQLKNKDEFFIQKAIGWALREYSKVKPDLVEEFIANHELSNLSQREGMKWLKREKARGGKGL